MAVEQSSRRQLACKVVDIRKFRPALTIGRLEQPAAAEDVDSRVQMRKLRELSGKQKRASKLEDKLRLYTREFEILNSIAHVSATLFPTLLSLNVTQPGIISLEKVFVTDNTM